MTFGPIFIESCMMEIAVKKMIENLICWYVDKDITLLVPGNNVLVDETGMGKFCRIYLAPSRYFAWTSLYIVIRGDCALFMWFNSTSLAWLHGRHAQEFLKWDFLNLWHPVQYGFASPKRGMQNFWWIQWAPLFLLIGAQACCRYWQICPGLNCSEGLYTVCENVSLLHWNIQN